MGRNKFFIAIFSIYFLLVNAFYILQNHLTGSIRYKNEISFYQDKISEERFHHSLAVHEFQYFKQQLAHWIPSNINKSELKKKSHYPLRSLASLVQAPNRVANQSNKSAQLYREAQSQFNSGEFVTSARLLKFLTTQFPASPHLIDSLFLLMESHYQTSDYDAALEVANQMIEHFPQHELSGFTMIRMGKIFEIHERTEEAIELYKLVLKVFPQREVASQALASLRASNL